MTLIAAYITNDLQIIASDFLITSKDPKVKGRHIPMRGNPQKAFSSEKIAIGLFGEFGFRMNTFKNEKLISSKMADEKWSYERLQIEIIETLENKHLDRYQKYLDFHPEYESNILVLQQNDDPKILKIQDHKIQKEYTLEAYKADNQHGELNELFFSEQQLADEQIDFEHQKQLLMHFNKLCDTPEEDIKIFADVPFKVKSMIRLVLDAMDSGNSHINRINIGGDKVNYAFSVKGAPWIENEYPNK